MNRLTCSLLLLTLALLTLSASFYGCSEKLVAEAPAGGPNVVLQAFLSPPPEMVTPNLVTVAVLAEDMIPMVDTLSFDGQFITGSLEVPAGTDRQFVLAVFYVDTSGIGGIGFEGAVVPLYTGRTVTDVRKDQVTELAIALRPEVPLVKLTPPKLTVERGAGFYVDLKVYNLVGLTDLWVEINHNSNYNYLVEPVAVVTPADRVGDYNLVGSWLGDGERYGVRVTDREGEALVDSRGDGTLARIFFRTDPALVGTDTLVTMTFDTVYAAAPDSQFDSTFARGTELTVNALVDYPVIIPDLNLRQYVIRAAGLQEPVVTLWYSDVDQITSLGLGEGDIYDLTGIGNLKNLWELWANVIPITDLSPLIPLARLQYLDCSHDEVSDLGPLASMPALVRVGMRVNQISDLTPLMHLPRLRYLDLSNNLITNIQPLVLNENLAAGDTINLQYNLLDDISLGTYIGILLSRKVIVYYGSPGSSPDRGDD